MLHHILFASHFTQNQNEIRMSYLHVCYEIKINVCDHKNDIECLIIQM